MFRKYTTVAIIVISMIFVGCRQEPGVTPQPPVVTDQMLCPVACEHIGAKGLNCEEGQPVDMKIACKETIDCKKGTCVAETCHVSCEQVCIDTENAGVWLDPGCVSNISSCDQIDMCPLARHK